MLTARQKQCHDYIRGYRAENGVSPSYDEIRVALGFASKHPVHKLILALEERGRLRRIPHRARAFEPLPEASTARPQVPHVTYTRANAQLFTVESGDGQAKLVPLPPELG